MRPIPRAFVAVLLLLAACAASTSRPVSPALSPERQEYRERLREACLETMLSSIKDSSTRAKFCDCSSEQVVLGLPVDVLARTDSSREATEAFTSALEQSLVDCSRSLGLPVDDPEKPAAGSAQTPSAPSIVQVLAFDATSRKVSAGSGFFVADHLVATNHHVVHDDRQVVIALGDREPVRADVVYRDRDLDVVILASPVAGEPLEIRTTPILEGETVLAWGFPQGREQIAFSSGTIQAVDEAFVVHDALIAAGSSGGPLTDEDGHVLGIVTFLAKSRRDAANESDRGIAVRMNVVLQSMQARIPH